MADKNRKKPVNNNGAKKNPADIFPDLKNGELVKAMDALKKEETPETQRALIERVISSRFFAPVDVMGADGKMLTGNGKIDIPPDAKFNFKLIENAKGERYFAVFTDINEFQKWNKTDRVNTIIVVFPQIAQLAAEKAEEVKGFVINPLTQNIIFSQEAIKNLLGAMRQFAEQQKAKSEALKNAKPIPVDGSQEDLVSTFNSIASFARQKKADAEAAKNAGQAPAGHTTLMFGKPNNVPEAVLGAFRKRLIKSPEVKEAYFCMMKDGEQELYLFVIDVDAEADKAKSIGEDLCNTAKMFLTRFPIIAAPVNSPFGEGAKKVTEPFYKKE